MSQDHFRLIFEYPHLGQDMVSESPPRLNTIRDPGDGPTFGPDPEAYPYDAASDTDTDDEVDSEDDQQEADDNHKAKDAPWHPLALHFLAQVPQSDVDWSRYLSCNGDVRSLCHRLKIPYLYPGFQAHLDWSRLFDECTWHLARACNNPPLASLFSLIFVAACYVALVDGCPRETVLKGLKACVRQCGISEDELTEPMLDRVREGVITGIGILREYTRVVGCRANEIPLHALRLCLLLFYQEPHPIDIPADNSPPVRVPGDTSSGIRPAWGAALQVGVRYQVICRILCSEGADEIVGYGNVDMIDVMEFDEQEEDEDDDEDRNAITDLAWVYDIIHDP
ncbi:hypothetical protein FSARC_6240 [Fusarium sarcochroum]|uniref:Uncharacterized protein n=1 Tax=Fusarium sarcochroum TaxID=1208366 RepID=A0A8H4TY36_9HYPO|nr:hypothetical protein FSARC_6240 [Fusarium sarcochroum]